MPTPFPGMDPYLEHPVIWPNVHNSLITALRDALSPLLRPRYFVAVQERSYLDDPATLGFVSIPDVGVIGPYTGAPVAVKQAPATIVEPMTIQLPPSPRVRETYLGKCRRLAHRRLLRPTARKRRRASSPGSKFSLPATND